MKREISKYTPAYDLLEDLKEGESRIYYIFDIKFIIKKLVKK